jgi:plastocyanin
VEPQTVFYIVGGALAVLAVAVAFFGLRERSFPGSRPALAGGVAVFALLVAATTTAAVISAREEQEHREAELAEEGAEGEEAAEEEAAAAEETGAEGPAGAAEQPGGAPAAGASTLELSSPEDGSTTFDPSELTAEAGEVTIEYTNPSPVQHNVAVEGDGQTLDEGDLVTDGDVSTASAELEPGEYVYYCSVPGHREAGMEGALTVE